MPFPPAVQSLEITRDPIYRRMLALQAPPVPTWYMTTSTDHPLVFGSWPWYWADLVIARERLPSGVTITNNGAVIVVKPL